MRIGVLLDYLISSVSFLPAYDVRHVAVCLNVEIVSSLNKFAVDVL